MWKIDVIDKLNQKLHKSPIIINSIIATSGNDYTKIEEFVPVRLSGQLLHQKSIFVGPRNAPSKELDQSDPFPREMSLGVGYFVITPLVLNNGQTVLVNRGWVPRSHVGQLISEGHNVGENGIENMEAIGITRRSEPIPRYVSNQQHSKGDLYVYAEIEAIARDKQLNQEKPILIDILEPKSSLIKRKSREQYINFHTTPQLHVIYAATWFSLSIIIAVLTSYKFIRKQPLQHNKISRLTRAR